MRANRLYLFCRRVCLLDFYRREALKKGVEIIKISEYNLCVLHNLLAQLQDTFKKVLEAFCFEYRPKRKTGDPKLCRH